MLNAAVRVLGPRVRSGAGASPRPWERRARWGLLGLGAVLAALFVLSFTVGQYPVSPLAALGVLVSQAVPLDPFWPPQVETVMLHIRLPRILGALVVGAALATSGAAFQGVLRNPMVAPDILGVASGAGFGAALALLLGWGGLALQGMAFLAGLTAVGITYALGMGRSRSGDGVLILVLSGLIVGNVFMAGISLVKVMADPNNTLPVITFWLMGSLASVQGADLVRALGPMAVGLCLLTLVRWRLNLLCFGDDEARALGVNVTMTRLAVIAAATLMTACAVALSGVIGLVGLIVPHMARGLVGPDFRVLLPASALLGGVFLLAVDDLARVMTVGEIPLGILTSLIGAPFFIMLLVRARRGWV
ncbi:FecCD family ABC transporter permease [Pararhodospirillum oryzae]|uniref:Iron ABC transporter permease n=1 Tax=Pararhodospirillum oryzae TaxID=478448 RepID=A0A512H3L7_9PROT|nr:iron ABC transporter permease [Pararhodospirillum oryzae]GEO80031.1 iron ABC transporter permease [Pararhodospirillum oryzae]